jgi:hypothetical protein
LHTEPSSLSHFLKILALGLSSLSLLGLWAPSPSWEFHLYSLLRNRYRGDAHHILSSVQASPWELDHPKFTHTLHWDVSWPTLGPFT